MYVKPLNTLKAVVDFINQGRLLGVNDEALLNCVKGSPLSREAFDAFITWFHAEPR